MKALRRRTWIFFESFVCSIYGLVLMSKYKTQQTHPEQRLRMTLCWGLWLDFVSNHNNFMSSPRFSHHVSLKNSSMLHATHGVSLRTSCNLSILEFLSWKTQGRKLGFQRLTHAQVLVKFEAHFLWMWYSFHWNLILTYEASLEFMFSSRV